MHTTAAAGEWCVCKLLSGPLPESWNIPVSALYGICLFFDLSFGSYKVWLWRSNQRCLAGITFITDAWSINEGLVIVLVHGGMGTPLMILPFACQSNEVAWIRGITWMSEEMTCYGGNRRAMQAVSSSWKAGHGRDFVPPWTVASFGSPSGACYLRIVRACSVWCLGLIAIEMSHIICVFIRAHAQSGSDLGLTAFSGWCLMAVTVPLVLHEAVWDPCKKLSLLQEAIRRG